MHKAGLPYSSRTCFPSSKTAIVSAHRGLLIAIAYTRTEMGVFSVGNEANHILVSYPDRNLQSECETNHTPAWARIRIDHVHAVSSVLKLLSQIFDCYST